MRISRTVALTGMAGAGALLAATLATAPAFAAGPGCNGAACEVDGSVTIVASITLAMPTDTFSDGSLAAGSTSPAPVTGSTPAQFTAVVTSGDSHGWSLVASAGSDFTAGNGNTLPATDLSIIQGGTGDMNWTGGGAAAFTLPEPGSSVSLITSPTVTPGGGSSSEYFTQVTTAPSSGAGNYTIPVDFTAIGA